MKHSKIFKSAGKHTDASNFPIQKKSKPFFSKGATESENKPFFQPLSFQLKRDSKSNKTGMPNQLKSGVENLSGVSLDDVKVHYNSSKPIQLQAFAYTQGKDIFLGPNQEKHLAHEAWHVAQQKQGRVQPTTYTDGFAVNDAPALEREADVMGNKASHAANANSSKSNGIFSAKANTIQKSAGVIQMKNFTDKYADSSFQSSSKVKEAIYMIYDSKHPQQFVEYVGKSSRPATQRYAEHAKEKTLPKSYKIQLLDSGSWTPFETATYEQFFIGEAGGKTVLINKINALDKSKWDWFKTPKGFPHNKDQADNLTSGHF